MGPGEKLRAGPKFSNSSPSQSPGPVRAAQVPAREGAERCKEYRPHRAPLPAPTRRPGCASGARGEVSRSSLNGRAGKRRLHAVPGATPPDQQRTPSNQRRTPTGGQPGASENPTGGSGGAPSSHERRRVQLIPLPGSSSQLGTLAPHAPGAASPRAAPTRWSLQSQGMQDFSATQGRSRSLED